MQIYKQFWDWQVSFILLSILFLSIPTAAQQVTWKVKINDENPNKFIVWIDASEIPNKAYLSKVYVIVNFFDNRKRRLNKSPQKYELPINSKANVIRKGKHTFEIELPYKQTSSVKGIKMGFRLSNEGSSVTPVQ